MTSTPTTTEPAAPEPGYVFSDRDGGPARHQEMVGYLAEVLDPFTTGRLAPLVDSSARCLEIGAGAGTVALWLAERTGGVVATDIDPQHIPDHPKLSAVRHDIVTDPLTDASFDLIHARLVLAHLPTRRDVLSKLVAALKPGGWVVIDEFADQGWDRCVLDTPDPHAQRLFDLYHQALVATMRTAGTDPSWGRQVHQAMRQAGLVEVQAEFGGGLTWHGGQAACLLPYAMTFQVGPQLREAGMSDADLARFRELLRDQRLVIHNSIAVSTAGRRPA